MMKKYGRKPAKPGCSVPRTRTRYILPLLCAALLSAACPFPAAGSAAAAGAGEKGMATGAPAAGSTVPYKPGEVLVRFTSPEAAEAIGGFLADAGVVEPDAGVLRGGEGPLARLELSAGVAVEDAVWLLDPLTGVRYAEPNYVFHAG